ncbi:MAG: hypothetical protein GYA34_00490 [Chloroflexi bacterium]|nr:hypothetical protein [Chloroflexota bacterium]
MDISICCGITIVIRETYLSVAATDSNQALDEPVETSAGCSNSYKKNFYCLSEGCLQPIELHGIFAIFTVSQKRLDIFSNLLIILFYNRSSSPKYYGCSFWGMP